MPAALAAAFAALVLAQAQPAAGPNPERLRVIVETDAGGDPDDEQSLVRFLLYANEWDVEGIIANRERARDGENLNTERTGLGIVRAMVDAYGVCYPRLRAHDPLYPEPARLRERTVAGYDNTDDGVKLIIAAVDRADAQPVWFLNWGTKDGCAVSCLKRALDRVLRERGPEGYAAFKSKLRLSSDDQFGDHTTTIAPAFPIWVDTFRPEMRDQGGRWYHRFSAITATAGGFDVERDVRGGHGPLGALYPTNTTHRQKEGDSMTFLYLVPTGMNDPNEPTWGSWAGRYGLNENYASKRYFWANQQDTWHDKTSRDNTLARWAVHLQNDFKARLDWCVEPFDRANHPPRFGPRGIERRTVISSARVELTAGEWVDPDKNRLSFEWVVYPEAGAYRGDLKLAAEAPDKVRFVAPDVDKAAALHIILIATDDGDPPLSRYRRWIFDIEPRVKP